MKMLEHVPLALYSTMRLGGKARYLVHVKTEDELVQAVEWADVHQLPLLMIGTGANLIFSDDGFNGLLIVNDIKGLELKDSTITAKAGEVWDDVVAASVKAGLSGIEALSKIPGKTGAAPVQNIGAYGQEIAQTLISVRAYDRHEHVFVTLKNKACQFGYRQSRFNRKDKGRFLITSVTLKLRPGAPSSPYYRDVQAYLDEHKLSEVTPAVIRKAVTHIRAFKLPDPSVVANSGSFFYNPVITKEEFAGLAIKHPAIDETPPGWTGPPRWLQPDGKIKLSAAWMVEQIGYKAYEDKSGLSLWPYQNLVIINKHAKNTTQLLKFAERISAAVYKEFGVRLQREPELVGG